MAAQETEPWLDDFALALTDAQIERDSRQLRQYEFFTGSKGLAAGWLSFVGVVGGAFGGLLPSGALWSSLFQPPAWLVALVLASVILYRATIAMFGATLGFLGGWCFFWGFLIALCAVGAAQFGSPYWAYGIAGGVGFLIGITHGVYEPPDMQMHDAWFALGMVLAPAGAVATAWSYRNLTDQPAMLAAAAAGAAAAMIFIAPLMAMLAVNWRNEGGLRRLAALYLHNDNYAAKAVALIDRALKIAPADASLLNLRGLAHFLLGDAANAEADWRRHRELQPDSVEPLVARGASLFRRGDVDGAIATLDEAVTAAPRNARAIATLGFTHHRRGNLDRAIALYEQAVDLAPEPFTMTRLAAACLEAGRYDEALGHSEVAISELDSTDGGSWLVRARAHLALGHLKEAEEDFLHAHQEGDVSVMEAARDALEAMGVEVD